MIFDDFLKLVKDINKRLGILEKSLGGMFAYMYFGELSVKGNAVATSIAGASTWAQIDAWDTEGESNGTTPDATENHIEVDNAGTYFVTASISFSGSANDTFSFQVKKNNGATSFDSLYFTRKLGAGGDVGSASISGLAVLEAGDTVELWAENETDGDDVVIEDGNLTVVRVA